MFCTLIQILPIFLTLWFLFTFFITYILALISDDVPSFWPYISDTGTFPPQSCIFGLLLTIGAILMAITLYIRYLHINYLIEKQNDDGRFLNIVCLMLGWSASLGIIIVASFQVSNAFVVHMIGAVMAFGPGAFYQITMCVLQSKYAKALNTSRSLLIIQWTFAIISIITFFLCFLFAFLAFPHFKGDNIFKWTKNDGGFELHLCSTISEWICASVTMFYMASLYGDFKQLKIEKPRVYMVN